MTNSPRQIYFLQNAEGNALGPFDAFLFLRGLKTLKLRLDCQQKNAQAIAEWLEANPQVTGGKLSGPDDIARLLAATQTGPRRRRGAEFYHGFGGNVAENR